MDKQELLSKELYTVVSMLTEMPHLMDGNFFVVYSDKEKALNLTKKLNDKIRGFYHGVPIKTCLITDCDKFFTEMIYSGFPLFLYDGAGSIHNLSEIYGIDFTLSETEKEIYTEYMGYLRMTKSVHIGKVKQSNINNAQQHLNSSENQKIVNNFKEKQNALKKSCKVVSESITATIPPENPHMPAFNYKVTGQTIETVPELLTVPDSYDPPIIRPDSIIPTNNNQEEKKNRPVVSAVMFILSAFFALAYIGVHDTGVILDMFAYGLSSLAYLGLGIAMTKMYLEQFGWAIIAVLNFALIIPGIEQSPTSSIILCLFLTVIPALVFISNNKNVLNRR